MSQIQRFGMAGVGPAGPILTLTGDIGGAVGPTGGNINILGESNLADVAFATIEGNPGTSTLTISPFVDTVSTVDATLTYFPIASVVIPASRSVVMSAHVIGNIDDYTAACGGYCVGVGRREAAGAAIAVGDNVLASEDAAAGTPQFGIALNGNNISVSVRGLAGQTWNWTCTFTYVFNLI